MFDIGAFELLIVAVLALVVVGPKDLPRVLRTCSDIIRKIKTLSGEFRSGLDSLAQEVDIDANKAFGDLDPFKDQREKEGLTPDMSPEEITAHILSSKKNDKGTMPRDDTSDAGSHASPADGQEKKGGEE